jgi:hypothetical protein
MDSGKKYMILCRCPKNSVQVIESISNPDHISTEFAYIQKNIVQPRKMQDHKSGLFNNATSPRLW